VDEAAAARGCAGAESHVAGERAAGPDLLQDVGRSSLAACPAAEELRCIAAGDLATGSLGAGLISCSSRPADELSPMRLLSLAACELQYAKQISTLEEERCCAVERLPKLCQVIAAPLAKILCQAVRFNVSCGSQLRGVADRVGAHLVAPVVCTRCSEHTL